MSGYRSRRRVPKGAQPGTLRYWQFRIALTLEAMEAGKITSSEAEKRVRMYTQAMQNHVHLKTMERAGIEDTPDPVAAEISDLPEEEPLVATTRTVTMKRGNTPKGPIDELTTVHEETVRAEDAGAVASASSEPYQPSGDRS